MLLSVIFHFQYTCQYNSFDRGHMFTTLILLSSYHSLPGIKHIWFTHLSPNPISAMKIKPFAWPKSESEILIFENWAELKNWKYIWYDWNKHEMIWFEIFKLFNAYLYRVQRVDEDVLFLQRTPHNFINSLYTSLQTPYLYQLCHAVHLL